MKLARVAFSITYPPELVIAISLSLVWALHDHTLNQIQQLNPSLASFGRHSLKRVFMDRPPCLDAVASISVVVSPERVRGSLLHCLIASNNTTIMSRFLIQNCQRDIQKAIKGIISFQFPDVSSATVHRICTFNYFQKITSNPILLAHQEQKPPPITS